VTVTFFRKPGHLLLPGRGHCGEIILVQISIAEKFSFEMPLGHRANDPTWWLLFVAASKPQIHRGHALVSADDDRAARLAA
jgi:NAD(P)H-hydrate epimerase